MLQSGVSHFAGLCRIVQLKGFRGVFLQNVLKVPAKCLHKVAQSCKVLQSVESGSKSCISRDTPWFPAKCAEFGGITAKNTLRNSAGSEIKIPMKP